MKGTREGKSQNPTCILQVCRLALLARGRALALQLTLQPLHHRAQDGETL